MSDPSLRRGQGKPRAQLILRKPFLVYLFCKFHHCLLCLPQYQRSHVSRLQSTFHTSLCMRILSAQFLIHWFDRGLDIFIFYFFCSQWIELVLLGFQGSIKNTDPRSWHFKLRKGLKLSTLWSSIHGSLIPSLLNPSIKPFLQNGGKKGLSSPCSTQTVQESLIPYVLVTIKSLKDENDYVQWDPIYKFNGFWPRLVDLHQWILNCQN